MSKKNKIIFLFSLFEDNNFLKQKLEEFERDDAQVLEIAYHINRLKKIFKNYNLSSDEIIETCVKEIFLLIYNLKIDSYIKKRFQSAYYEIIERMIEKNSKVIDYSFMDDKDKYKFLIIFDFIIFEQLNNGVNDDKN